MSAPNFRKGMAAAEEAAARTSFARTEFLSIEDGKYADVRFLTDSDDIITVAQHNNVPTRNAPADYKNKWPQKMSGICRMDTHEGVRTFPDYEDCFLCLKFQETGEKTYKPQPRAWGLAVARKQLLVDGRVVGMEDEMQEVEIDGKKTQVPKILILNFSWHNFWGGLSAITQLHGTWLDRDIRILRKGKELDTDYNFAAMSPVDATTGRGDAITEALDLRIVAHRERYAHAPSIGEVVTERSTDEFYDRFFDVRHEQPKTETGSVQGAGNAAEVSKPDANEPSADALAAMAARVGAPAPAEAPAANDPNAVPTFGS